MKLYKFTSLKNANLVLENGLWFSNFLKVNDPMEGLFYYSHQNPEIIINAKESIGICCLTECYKNPLLWALYADNGKSICFEINGDTLVKCGIKINKITYSNYIKFINNSEHINNGNTAKKLLTHKLSCWKYEKEYRGMKTIFNEEGESESNTVKSIESIFLGYKLSNLFTDKNEEYIQYPKTMKYFEIEHLVNFENILDKILKNNFIKVFLTKIEEDNSYFNNNKIRLTGKIEKSEQLTRDSLVVYKNYISELINKYKVDNSSNIK